MSTLKVTHKGKTYEYERKYIQVKLDTFSKYKQEITKRKMQNDEFINFLLNQLK